VSEAAERLMQVFVVSDGTGETASAAARAVMLQFRDPWRLRVFGGVRSESQARRAVEEAAEAGALVVFTLVDARVVAALLAEAGSRRVETLDLLGPLFGRVASRLGAEPRSEPGLLRGFTADYFQRVEAVEFAVRHDDGANTHTLHDADIVLTGVSRTSKTPLSMYLAQRGYKTGNVPLVPGLEPPRPLLEIDPRKVFGLLVDPATLLTVRTARVRQIGSPPYSTYTDPESVMDEITRARRLFRERGWKSLDITGRAVEENAARIVEMVERAR
jgi:[pyruvate, water dikinase]-phosphate phosphotransferase / [pyruvate, water dikinase] kinase